jgi:hypothetical protein
MSEDSIDAEHEAAKKIVKKAVADLSEHFDSVQVFCSRYVGGEDGGTLPVVEGRGNWFARFGQTFEWVEFGREGARIKAREDEK